MKLAFAQKLQAMSNHAPEQRSYKLILQTGEHSLYADATKKIMKIKWKGAVEKSNASEIFITCAKNFETGNYEKLIIDHSELVEFDTQARIWIKTFLEKGANEIPNFINKVAYLNPTSSAGNIFANMMTSAISTSMPTLAMEKFSNEGEASSWIAA